ncbi:MAG: 16S rRNA (uracil(1498)-N(3))-methyltransferase [Kiritimatiellae bacterium]|nr:16S rRNA (uracil(1498)-N(3))-methyltransferase [Kiritimatiellia bacterium]
MNRILFEPGEIVDGIATFGGPRADHVLDVLHGEPGQTLKTGVLDGAIGTSEIVAVGTDSEGGRMVSVRVSHDAESLRPWVDLILAPPRPRVMKRLLPQLAAMGVGRIVLVGAKKVEKDFWGATLLKPENYRPLLIDGLMQSGTSILPVLETRRNFRRFVADELDAMFGSGERIVAHPYGDAASVVPVAERERLLLAVGPEGGWTEEEVELLESRGFRRRSLGPRILRTDTATVALLARLFPA